MTLLDRFRTPSRQKHPDPTVRLAYVAELPLSERELIIAAAREDEDVRVRRAAVAKLLDPAALSAIARDDADAGVRADAQNMLRDIALDVFEGISEAESLAAVDALAGADRMLAQIAKTSAREAIGLRALRQLDPAAHAPLLGSIARHAPLEPVRQAAFAGLHERADILAVAINGEFKDIAVAAVDRLAERADLEQVAARAKNKAAAKRAGAVLRELDDRAARNAAPAAAATNIEEQVMSLEMPVETPVAEAPESAMETPRVETMEREAAEARALEEPANAQAAERASTALDTDAERAVENAATEQAAARTGRCGTTRRDEAESSREAERRKQAGEAEARDRRDGLNRLNQLLGRADALIQKPDLSLKTATRVLRDLKAALADVPPLPSRRDYEEVVQRLKAAQAALTPKVQDLREVAEWQQWANIGIQEQLCEKMEALRTVEDSEAVARRIRELQEQWRQAADVPRAQGEALWRRFKAIHDELWARCEAHFAAQAGARRGEPREESGPLRAGRGARRLDQLARHRRRDQRAAGGMEEHRRGHARTGESRLGTVPRCLRSVLHEAPGGSRQTQDGLERELREKGSAVRGGRSAVDVDRLGPRRGRSPSAAERVESHRPGEEEPVGGHLAAFSRRVRRVFRTPRAAPRRRARRACRGARGHLRRARSAGVIAGRE